MDPPASVQPTPSRRHRNYARAASLASSRSSAPRPHSRCAGSRRCVAAGCDMCHSRSGSPARAVAFRSHRARWLICTEGSFGVGELHAAPVVEEGAPQRPCSRARDQPGRNKLLSEYSCLGCDRFSASGFADELPPQPLSAAMMTTSTARACRGSIGLWSAMEREATLRQQAPSRCRGGVRILPTHSLGFVSGVRLWRAHALVSPPWLITVALPSLRLGLQRSATTRAHRTALRVRVRPRRPLRRARAAQGNADHSPPRQTARTTGRAAIAGCGMRRRAVRCGRTETRMGVPRRGTQPACRPPRSRARRHRARRPARRCRAASSAIRHRHPAGCRRACPLSPPGS